MLNSKKLILLFIIVTTTCKLQAQEVILNSKTNRFLINQNSDKPRLDVIVQGFTEYEKNEISKRAVMDTTTKPAFEKVSETEYNIKASRMGEKLTFVIRDFQKLKIPYGTDFDWGIMNSSSLKHEAGNYILGAEKCRATGSIPFGANKVVIKITDNNNLLVFKLNITFTYPKPQLAYIDVIPYIDTDVGENGSPGFLNFIKDYNLVPTVYAEGPRVAKKVVVAEADLYFGFKQGYYDGQINPTNVSTMISNRFWRVTGKSEFPFTHLYFEDENSWNWLESGKYDLFYTYDQHDRYLNKYSFEIKHSWIATAIHRITKFIKVASSDPSIKPWILIILLCITSFFIVRNRLKKAREAARKTKLELQSIQAQLNPHFIFNAMASIQGLINKNEIEKANTYLTDFSKLLRNSLNNSGQEMVPLSEELRTLDSYIRLEKLRFNFQYKLYVDENIETSNVEIPSLLIQPLIENAIKHGISGLGESGLLNISFIRVRNDLVVEVEDNGKGFDEKQESAGNGLRLTRERVRLLNRSKKRINLKIESVIGGGTVARLTLKHAL